MAPQARTKQVEPRRGQRPLVTACHTAVPGRYRFRVRGLYRSPAFAERLAARLATRPDLPVARISTASGTILLVGCPLDALSATSRLDQVLWDELEAAVRYGDQRPPSASDAAWHAKSPDSVRARLRS